jgi:ribosomal protein L11 methylase PrmA
LIAVIIFIFLALISALAVLKITFALLTGLSAFRTGGAVFTTTHKSKIQKILETILMNPGQIVFDLGCGDGRFLIAAEKRYKIKAFGFEINPWPYFLSKIRVMLQGAHVSIRFKDFWNADLREADFVFCYLFPDLMERLKEKLSKELKTGATVISCNFEIPGWKPVNIISSSHRIHKDPIFIYKIIS